MLNLKKFISKTLLVLVLFAVSVHLQDLKDFRLAPIDKISYYGKTQRLLQVCVPPVGDESEVEWRKGNRTLKSTNRVSVFTSRNVAKYVKNSIHDIKKVFLLEFKPVLIEDQGGYTCVALNSQREANFRIIFTDTCDKNFFKCSMKDDTCIVNSTVCDGNKDCDDASDESINAGCPYPDVPFNLHVVARSWNQVKLSWNSVKNAISYEIMNNENESIIVTPEKSDAIFDGLRSGDMHQFFIRTESYTGYSNFSTPVEVKTTLYSKLKIPRNFDGLDIEGVGIIVCWSYLQGAESYQVLIGFPDGSNKSVEVLTPDIVVKHVFANATYTFQVKQWSGFEYGTFSETISVKTRPIQEITYPPMEMSIDPNGTISLSWKKPVISPAGYRINSRLNEMTYVIQTCQMKAIYKKSKTNATLVSDVEIQNYVNTSNNNIKETVSLKNYTIHYIKEHITFLRYENTSCETTRREPSEMLEFKIEGLVADAIYRYEVLTYFSGRIVGQYTEGNFTVPRYITPDVPEPTETFTGVVIYGISCGILIIILIISFFLAYFCKWEKLMSDIAIKKARMTNEANQAEMDKSRPLLIGSFINEQSRSTESR